MKAKAQTQKDEIISELVETRRKILDAAAALPPAKRDEVFLGVWSVKDLLAHLAGWDDTNRQAAEELLAGQVPSFYGHHDRDWQTYNAGLVAAYRQEDFTEQLTLAEDTQQTLIAFLETLPAAEFDKDRGVRFRRYKVTIARLLQAEADDEKVHLAQIEEFRDKA